MTKHPVWIILMGILSMLFGCSSESNYHKKSGKWHYDGVPVNREIEPVNFKVIDDYYARDDTTGFYRGTPVYGGRDASDGPSFTALNTWYAKDKFRVYYCDTERDSREYWSIRKNVIKTVAGANAVTFRLLSDGYTARDAMNLFQEDKIVQVQDLESYELLEHAFARDRVRGYYRKREVAGSDGASFAALDAHYAKDKARIYYVDGFYIGGTIKGVRHESFNALGDGYATDGSRGYYKGKTITSEAAASLQYLEAMGYAKTAGQVFYSGELMQGADAPSFGRVAEFNAKFDATDKLGHFSAGQRVNLSP